MEIKEFEKSGLKFIKLKNNQIEVTLCNLGASMYQIIFDGANMIMTPVDVEAFLDNANYHGKTVGRTGNRIPGNEINIDGKIYKLQNNEGRNTLHGGKNGVSTKIWKYKVISGISQTKVAFYYSSKNKESGFPGNLKIKCTYTIKENSSKIKVSYLAKTNQPTLCNLTNHAFFTLGDSSVANLKLKINASNYLVTTEDEMLPIEKSPVFREIDFRKFKLVGKHLNSKVIRKGMANGYDLNFYLDQVNPKIPQVVIKNDKRMMKIYTDYPCVQFYSENYGNVYKWIDLCDGTNRSAVLEPQDDYLIRNILRPGEKYIHFFTYEFKVVN